MIHYLTFIRFGADNLLGYAKAILDKENPP